jgi:hypothetical protein
MKKASYGKRTVVSILVAVLILASLVVFTGASDFGPPVNDAWVDVNEPDKSSDSGTALNNLWVRGDTTSCTPSYRTYLKWDLSDVSDDQTIASAIMTLYANATTGNFDAPRNITLYRVAGDSWGDNVTWNTAPAVGAAIQTVSYGGGAGYVVFNNSALAEYLNGEAKGDNIASFALQMTGDCTAGTVGIRFDSSDKVGGIAPDLEMRNPTSIGFYSFRAGSAGTGTLILAGVLLTAVFVSGVVLLRRRAIR